MESEIEQHGPAEELSPAVDDYIPGAAELAVVDPQDRQEVFLRMDDHDIRLLLEQIQGAALRKWVYKLDVYPYPSGLTIHAVQDITQRLNWTGKCKIGVLPDTLTVERITEDAGNGPEPFWVATIFARDEITGAMLPGSSMEPVRMKLKAETARKKRAKGQKIPEDNTIFDPFSRWKAIQKATRNALAGFIPEEIEQTIIAMFEKDPNRVERIRTEHEAKIAELPPPLMDDKALEQIKRAEAVYAEIRELGGGRGKVEFPPGQFGAFKLQAQHSHDRLDDLIAYVERRREEIAAKYESGDAA